MTPVEPLAEDEVALSSREREAAAFHRAILDNPADDTVRLVYADWLEERGGDPPHAQLIRLQVEIAISPWACDDEWCSFAHPCDHCKPYAARLLREMILLKARQESQSRAPCSACEGFGRVRTDLGHGNHRDERCPSCVGGDLLRCPKCADSGKPGHVHRYGDDGPGYEPCGYCEGTERRSLVWLRGFPVILCESDEVWRRRPAEFIPRYVPVLPTQCDCGGTLVERPDRVSDARGGYPSKWCRRCFATVLPSLADYEFAGTDEVEPTPWARAVSRLACGPVFFHARDRHPASGEGGYCWREGRKDGDRSRLPPAIAALCPLTYCTLKEADVALRYALGVWVARGGQPH